MRENDAFDRPHLSAHDDPARICVADCCVYEDGSPRWMDRDGARMGPMPPSDHPYWVWREYHRPPAPPWGSYLDETPLPLPPGGGGPFSHAMDVVAQGVVR